MYSRTELLIGKEALNRLKEAHVMVVGLGGVGAYAAEMLCRAGVGKMTIIDQDIINKTNRNRQLIALSSTEGKPKVNCLAERLRDINPEINLVAIKEYIRDERMIEILKQDKYDYVIDAIDTLSPKMFLIIHCLDLNIPIVSSMGSGGKLDPTQVRISDISQSYNCPLASKVRKKIHKFGIYNGFAVVFSSEKVDADVIVEDIEPNKKSTVGTISYLPPIFGCMAASVVIRKLIGHTPYDQVKDKRYYANKKEKKKIYAGND